MVILLMEEILRCIKPVNNEINYLSTGAGFQSSTVSVINVDHVEVAIQC